MAFPTPAQGRPDGQGMKRSPAFFTVGTNKLSVQLNPYLYGFDPAGTTTPTNAAATVLGLKFYADTATDLETADAGSVETSQAKAIADGYLVPLKVTYKASASTAPNAPKKLQTTRLLCPVSKVVDAMAGLRNKVLYDNIPIVDVGFFNK